MNSRGTVAKTCKSSNLCCAVDRVARCYTHEQSCALPNVIYGHLIAFVKSRMNRRQFLLALFKVQNSDSTANSGYFLMQRSRCIPRFVLTDSYCCPSKASRYALIVNVYVRQADVRPTSLYRNNVRGCLGGEKAALWGLNRTSVLRSCDASEVQSSRMNKLGSSNLLCYSMLSG